MEKVNFIHWLSMHLKDAGENEIIEKIGLKNIDIAKIE